jgi:hypothetical protein
MRQAVGERRAYRDKPSRLAAPVRPVDVFSWPTRSNKLRIRWLDGEFEGLAPQRCPRHQRRNLGKASSRGTNFAPGHAPGSPCMGIEVPYRWAASPQVLGRLGRIGPDIQTQWSYAPCTADREHSPIQTSR